MSIGSISCVKGIGSHAAGLGVLMGQQIPEVIRLTPEDSADSG